MTRIRMGLGYDSHRWVRGRPLVLGGVRIPWSRGLAGHSDADAVLHAVTDALLGGAALGDIGTLFPDSSARWKGADSFTLLTRARRQVPGRFRVNSVDVTVLAEEPRLGPYKNRMRARIARALGIPVDRVSVKAKTNERMGSVGRREGLAALAVCTLEEREL